MIILLYLYVLLYGLHVAYIYLDCECKMTLYVANNLLENISSMLENIEDSSRKLDYIVNDYYIILTRAFIEIRQLRQANNVLEAKIEEFISNKV